MTIKSLELEPTKENIITSISRDLIDRNRGVWRFVRFCNEQDDKCSIAIDAGWGYGKTFFIKQVKMLIEAFNNFTTALTDEERTSIKAPFAKYIGIGDNAVEIAPQVCVYYDAWSNDYDIDPILSLVYEIIRSTANDYEFKKNRDCLKIAAGIVDFFTGRNVADIVELSKREDPLSVLKNQKDIHCMVAEFLDSLLYEQGNRLVVFIDELDRCRPSYAVQMLERIKHYFANDRITFVFSVNIEELQHTVKRYYGNEFDACRYLDRFFDYRIALPTANMERYYQEIGLENGSWVFESVCKAVAKHYAFGLREVEKFYRLAKISAYKPTHNHSLSGFSDGNGLTVGLFFFVPIIIGLRMVDADLYKEFISGKNSQPLIDVLGNGDLASGICSMLLDNNETYDESTASEKRLVCLEDKLNDAYNAMFDDNQRGQWGETNVGKCSFSKETRDKVMRITSMLSEYSSFE